MPDILAIGTRVRSYDFPNNYQCYVEGVIEGYGGDIFPSDAHYRVKVGRQVIEGKQVADPVKIVYPPFGPVFGQQLIYPLYGKMPVRPITKERFHEMLNILPPSRWYRGEALEWFHMCERLSGDYVTWFCRAGDRYFEFQDLCTIDTIQIREEMEKGFSLPVPV